MPTMDGFEFLAKLREHDTKTPVLMLSARDSPVDVAKGFVTVRMTTCANLSAWRRSCCG